MKRRLTALLLLLASALFASPILVSGSGSFACDPQGVDYSISFTGQGVSVTANSIYALGCPFPSPSLSGFVHGAGFATVNQFSSSWFSFSLGNGLGSLTLFQNGGLLAQVDLAGWLDVDVIGASPLFHESYGNIIVGEHAYDDDHDSHVPEPGTALLFMAGAGALLTRRLAIRFTRYR